MTVWYSNYYNAAADGSGKYTSDAPRPLKSGEVAYFRGSVDVTTNLEIGDKVRFFPMPKGARLAMFAHQWGDLDSSTTLVADLGQETSDSNAYLAASTIYQAADTTLASGEGSNILTEWSTELLADAAATTVEDHLALTVTTAATSLAATRTITFQGMIYLP